MNRLETRQTQLMIAGARWWLCWVLTASLSIASGFAEPVRVFIFAGQSNMEGADSKVEDIKRFPPFAGLDQPQPEVRFSYCIGREDKKRSNGWVDLQPVNNLVGPELSFARTVRTAIDAPLAIIKVAAGGTDLGNDWNPDQPGGFKMYPLLLKTVRSSLKQLDDEGVDYRLEGFVWHQGENDMFNKDYLAHYGDNLEHFIARCRADLSAPKLKFYIGELCTKTIWGMDLRPRMYAISLGQKQAAANMPLVEYVPTSHVAVEIGNPVGLHYHYGTLGQLEHGVNYAEAYLRTIGKARTVERPLKQWPFAQGSTVKLFILAGHRNMEGERAFVQQLAQMKDGASLLRDDPAIPFRYSIGGGYKRSDGWEPLGPAGYYDTFGPELSFGHALENAGIKNVAIAKFTHSGSQIIDWTPEGSEAKSRNLYPKFLDFVRESISDLSSRGYNVELAGIFYHVGENDGSFGPYRKAAAERLRSIVKQSRLDLQMPDLKWYVSEQPPTDDKSVNQFDVVGDMEALAAADMNLIYVKAFHLPKQELQLVLDTAGIVALGEKMAHAFLHNR